MAIFSGVDTKFYPGAGAMQAIKHSTNMSWCAYYLAPTPARKDCSWVGKRAELAALGWGLAPVYLGQQAATCQGNYSCVLTAEQGSIDAAAACRLAGQDGFPPGTYIYLDWEDGCDLQDDAALYLSAFARGVASAGFAAGFYCSHRLADAIEATLASLEEVPDARIWVWKVATTHSGRYAGNRQVFSTCDPADAWPSAAMWQYMQDCNGAFDAFPGVVDLNTSLWADPGSK